MDQLPEGWVKCKSKKRSGRSYYFNVRTGETTWSLDKISLSSSSSKLRCNSPQISQALKNNLKTPAQDRLKRLQNDLKLQREHTKKSAIPKVARKPPNINSPETSKSKSLINNGKTDDISFKKPLQKVVSTKTKETEPNTFRKPQNVQKNLTQTPMPTETRKKECKPSVKSETVTKDSLQKNIDTEKQKAEPVIQEKVKVVQETNLVLNDVKKNYRISRKNSPKTIKTSLKSSCESQKLQNVKANNNRKRKYDGKDEGTTNKINKKSLLEPKEAKEIIPSTVSSNKSIIPAYNFNPPNSRDELTENFKFYTNLVNDKPKSANERLANLRKLLAHNRELAKDTSRIKENENVVKDELIEPTPMDWEDSDINNEISDIRQEDKMEDYYDVVSHNLFKIASEKQEKSSELSKNWYYFVIDTNVFLSNLKFIDDLTKLKPPGTTGTVIYVPYCVLQELDKLKSRTNASTSTFAVRAIKYLNAKFSSSESCVKGQSAIEARNRIIKILNADDEIINCCLQLKEVTSNVMLLSNDVNLRNKAFCNNILASTKSDLESFDVADA